MKCYSFYWGITYHDGYRFMQKIYLMPSSINRWDLLFPFAVHVSCRYTNISKPMNTAAADDHSMIDIAIDKQTRPLIVYLSAVSCPCELMPLL